LVRARLDAALAKREVSELRAARAHLARAAGEPLQAGDLEAAAKHELPLDALAAHALQRGLTGDDAVGVARGLAARFATSRPLAELAGVLACARGDPALRTEAQQALERAKPWSGKGALLAPALALADQVASGLAKDQDPANATRKLAGCCQPIARAPELAGAIGVILDPVATALLDLWRTRRVDFALRGTGVDGLLDLLGGLEATLPPRLLALRLVLASAAANPDVTRGALERAAVERAAEAAGALARTEPLLAASTLDEAIRRDLPPEQLDDAGIALRRARLDLADAAIANARGLTKTETEESTAVLVARRHAENRARLEETAAARGRDPESRRATLEKALAARRRALDLSAGSPLLARVRDVDARGVVAVLFALERWDELARPAQYLGDAAVREAVLAEVARRSGDARAAHARAGAAATQETIAPDPWAALALAASDLGLADEARRALARARTLEVVVGPVSEAFRAAAGEEHLDRKR
jgi:hypothetical protein